MSSSAVFFPVFSVGSIFGDTGSDEAESTYVRESP